MSSIKKLFVSLVSWKLLLPLLLLMPLHSYAYPDAEITGSSGSNPPFDFSVSSTLTGFFLISDDELAFSYTEHLKLADMGIYDLMADQPPALTTDDETDGNIMGIGYESSRNQIIASQSDGDVLIFDLDDVTAIPQSLTIAEDNSLGPVVIDSGGQYAYVADDTSNAIHVVNLADVSLSGTATIEITGHTSFYITDGIFVEDTNEAYFTTDVGYVIYMSSGATTAAYIEVISGNALSSIAAFTDATYLYAVDQDASEVYKIATGSHTLSGSAIDISENTSPTHIIITDVESPTATYAYVAGTGGVSVINTGNDEVLDLGDDPDVDGEPMPTSATPEFLAATSAADGYVYMAYTTGDFGVITDNPWVEISALTYSDDATVLGVDGSFTMTFQASVDGTYAIRAGGDSSGNGTILTDSDGNTSGALTAETDVEVTINYSDNSSAFAEGTNNVWVFVTSDADSSVGRRATQVTVDTPPDVVTINSTGWGNEKIYVTVTRLTAEDISSYRFYVGSSEEEVLASTSVHTSMSQDSSGSTQTATIGGLTNEVLYFVAVDAIDENGNVSPSRSVTSETTSETQGPCEILGERGCSLAGGGRSYAGISLIILSLSIFIMLRFRRSWIFFAVFFILIGFSSVAFAQQEFQETDVYATRDYNKPSRQLFEMELKTGFWMPKNTVLKNAFTNCCNLITRVQMGLLFNKRYGVGIGAGFLYKSARAYGSGSHAGERATERFKLYLLPLETNFTWRADYFTWRYIIPYIRGGVDYVLFKQALSGGSTKGIKYGLHGTGGIALNVGDMAGTTGMLDGDYGINDLMVTLEAQYQWIDSFGGRGLDLSGYVFSIGMLVLF